MRSFYTIYRCSWTFYNVLHLSTHALECTWLFYEHLAHTGTERLLCFIQQCSNMLFGPWYIISKNVIFSIFLTFFLVFPGHSHMLHPTPSLTCYIHIFRAQTTHSNVLFGPQYCIFLKFSFFVCFWCFFFEFFLATLTQHTQHHLQQATSTFPKPKWCFQMCCLGPGIVF